MRETIEKYDYVGFTFNSIHSSQFGLSSVTSSNRYSQDLFPNFKDITVETNNNGAYYFGSRLQTCEFSMNLAFKDITETEFREIRVWLYNDGNIGTLIFDELPYKKYYCKCSKNPKIKFLTFEDTDGERVYKGEMALNFVGYDVYGYIVDKWLDNYTDENLDEWYVSSKLLNNNKVSEVAYYDTYNAGNIPLYNPGDFPTDFILTMTVNNTTYTTIVVTLGSNDFTIDTSTLTNGSTITVDTKKRLIKNGTTVINNLLIDGELFQIPISTTVYPNAITMTISSGASAASINYLYKYL